MTILSINEAKHEVCSKLKAEHGIPARFFTRNEGRYAGVVYKDGYSAMIVYKRDFYKTFGRLKEGEGFADSINAIDLIYCLNSKIDNIYFCYKEGDIYYASPLHIWENSTKRTTENEGKKVFSFAIKNNLTKLNKQEKNAIIRI